MLDSQAAHQLVAHHAISLTLVAIKAQLLVELATVLLHQQRNRACVRPNGSNEGRIDPQFNISFGLNHVL